MLQYDPEKRISIEEIKSHPWYQEKVDLDVMKELSYRKLKVEEYKSWKSFKREKAEEKECSYKNINKFR